MPKKIEISHRTIVFTVLFLMFLWFLFTIRDIIFLVFVSTLVMTILNPTVRKLNRYKIPRVASVLIVYISVLALIIFIVAAIIPPLVEQTTNFANSLPRYLRELKIPVFLVDSATAELTKQLGQLPGQIVKISLSVFSNILSVLAVFIFALYLLLYRDKLTENLATIFSQKEADRIEKVLNELEGKLGGWARGQLILMFLVGFSTYIGLLILGVPFALPLALLAGILELVPNIGPFLASIPAVIVGFGISPFTGLAVAALGFLIQQIENYVFVPKVMERSAGVSPLVTLLALLIGFRLAGIPGAILSVPIVITIGVLLREYLPSKNP